LRLRNKGPANADKTIGAWYGSADQFFYAPAHFYALRSESRLVPLSVERDRPNIRFNFQHLSGLGPERHPRGIVVAKFHSAAPRSDRATRYCPAASRGCRHYHFRVVYRKRWQPIRVASERHDFGCAP